MRFFRFSHNSSQEREWARAVSIQPTSHEVAWHCELCGRAANFPSGSFDVKVEGGPWLPDFLGCGSHPLLIVSERVVSGWETRGIRSFRAFPVGISAVSESRVQLNSSLRYYRIQISGECRVNFLASGATITSICKLCGEVRTDVPYIRDYALLAGSWDGSPLFRDNRFFPNITFCSEEAKKIAEAERFTNIRFEPVA